MSQEVQLALIAAVVVLVPLVFNYWTARATRREAAEQSRLAREDAKLAREAQKKAAEKIEEVKETLAVTTNTTDQKLNSIARTADDTHTLVNANMGAALNVNRITTRRLADLTKGTDGWEADEAAAELAANLYAAHEAKQATVDAAVGKPVPVTIVQVEPVDVKVVEHPDDKEVDEQ